MTFLGPSQRRLQDVVAAPDFAVNALRCIHLVSTVRNPEDMVDVLHEAAAALGAEQAFFVSFVRDDDSAESFRFILDCDPVWCMAYQEQAWYVNDPWLVYAQAHSEPTCSSAINCRTKSQRDARALAAQYGFVSAYVIPAPAAAGLSRIGVLGLGSSQQGYFEAGASVTLKVLAQGLSMELHQWWVKQMRKEIIERNRLTPEDLQLLEYERRELGTKEIAELMCMTWHSVNSKFQRLNLKFNTGGLKVEVQHVASR
jgi:hypothetical protein